LFCGAEKRRIENMFPIFLKLEGRRCLVVGAGKIAEGKIRSLLQAGALVRAVAPEAILPVRKLVLDGSIEWYARGFESHDLDGVFLVIAATSSADVNAQVFAEAEKRNVLCNSVDDPEHCDFYYPAVVNRGDLQIAISTNGRSPALAQRLRKELEEQFGPEYEAWVKELGEARDELTAKRVDLEPRRKLLHELASREAFANRYKKSSTGKPLATGTVFLVGAGPGDPELLTLKAAKVLRAADVVLHDELVSAEILRLIPATAQLINVGKRSGKKSAGQEEINRLLVQHALMGLQVVRLKGGDPFIFGRGGEELQALREAGIRTEVVPGVTSALGAAAAVQIPLTHRDVSSALIVVTGSSKQQDQVANWPSRIPSNATVIVYMPGSDLASLTARLLASGVASGTPCALIASATLEAEQVHITTVANLDASPELPAPRLLVVGEVVRLADAARLRQQFAEFSLSASTEQQPEISSTAGETAE
jgi:uroporphyrin-III C-methyltransferase/precorrin-2 dehydrogenase/sirohydrochlorin ferrochelatase